MIKSLDTKLAAIHADPGCREFIIADAKDADMALGIGAPGQSPEMHSDEIRFRTLEEYREQIKSEIADIKNVGGRKAGTITGAYFIREFVEDTPWAHLDIAGTAWNDSNKPHLSVGPTGVCVRTLVNLVCG